MLRVKPLCLCRSCPLSSDKEEQPCRGGECPGCGQGAGVSSEQTQPGTEMCHAGIHHVGHLGPESCLSRAGKNCSGVEDVTEQQKHLSLIAGCSEEFRGELSERRCSSVSCSQ